MAESQWTAQELQNIGNAIVDLEERLQEWEAETGFKVGDLLLNVETQDRPVTHLGLVTFISKVDTTLQFEVLDVEPSLTLS